MYIYLVGAFQIRAPGCAYNAIYVKVWELKLYFYPSAGGLKKKTKKTGTGRELTILGFGKIISYICFYAKNTRERYLCKTEY